PPASPLFPYTTLFRSRQVASVVGGTLRAMRLAVGVEVATGTGAVGARAVALLMHMEAMLAIRLQPGDLGMHHELAVVHLVEHDQDRKSTRLNSSHSQI